MKASLCLFLILTFSIILEGASQSLYYNAVLEDKSSFVFHNNTSYTLTVKVINPNFYEEPQIINAGENKTFRKKENSKKVKQVNFLIVYEESAYDQRQELLESKLRSSILKIPEQYFKDLELTREEFIALVAKEFGGTLLKSAIQAWEAYKEFMAYKAIVDEIISLHNQLEINNRVFRSQYE